ncbi:hypothetical protein NEIELOOT_01152 [Neisseria elongata subsp. glycolytica ATCC 29315]|uniref:Uncharacterized protein n=1 Tax=Neisseria elongata subsp. glycolytica ATCC 29315 TaxID=546263 RepID=D4DQ15_NEIEG|nr:hypothetical protein NEIELOOT_01152 [Neisseria elongata subsp. glycolytica ATCC 29315]
MPTVFFRRPLTVSGRYADDIPAKPGIFEQQTASAAALFIFSCLLPPTYPASPPDGFCPLPCSQSVRRLCALKS